MNGKNWSIIGIYTPHFGQKNFFINSLQNVEEMNESNSIIIGDFNEVMDVDLDRSTSHSGKGILKLLKEWLKENSVIDICQYCNQTKRYYTFYSGTHQSYSRTDYILHSSNLIKQIKKVTI